MHDLTATLGATWSPFVLVAGLLLIGHVAAGEGLFRFVGSRCARVPGGGVSLFFVTMIAVAAVTAVLNLDTSVVFMTPVALHAARSKGVDEKAFLYGTIFMSNSASLLLVGSNLTNLLVFSSLHVDGSIFARHMLTAWLLSVILTTVVVGSWQWRALRRSASARVADGERCVFGPGVVGAAFAVVAMLTLSRPALWVFAAGVVAELYEIAIKRRTTMRNALSVASPYTLSSLFIVAVCVGWFARFASVTKHLLVHASEATTIASAAFTSLVINNLPAASLFAAHHVAHPYALLLGLDLGPNCAVTGALSSLLWLRVARSNGARPSLLMFSVVGTIVAVTTMVCVAPLLVT